MNGCYLCGAEVEDTDMCGDCQTVSTLTEVRMKQMIARYYRAKFGQ